MAQEFVRRVVIDHLSEPFDDEMMPAESHEPVRDIFACLSRFQLESLIEQVQSDAPLSERLAVATQIFIAGKCDSYKQRHNIRLRLPQIKQKRQLPHGQLALLSRSELEDFSKTS